MQILGIKEYGIKKYLAGTLKGGILLQSEEERYNLYLELIKKQYPGTYTDLTPIWSLINPSKEMKSYGEFLEELKTSNPEEYNRIMESSAQSETSEISKPWIDSEGNVRRSTNVGAGFVSGNDPIMQMYVEGVALNPVFKAVGTAGLYGLGRLGNNWARAKILSNLINNMAKNKISFKELQDLYIKRETSYGPNITVTKNPGWRSFGNTENIANKNIEDIRRLDLLPEEEILKRLSNPHMVEEKVSPNRMIHSDTNTTGINSIDRAHFDSNMNLKPGLNFANPEESYIWWYPNNASEFYGGRVIDLPISNSGIPFRWSSFNSLAALSDNIPFLLLQKANIYEFNPITNFYGKVKLVSTPYK